MNDLLRSHAELRAAVRLAGIRLRDYNRVRDRELLELLRRALRDSRKVTARYTRLQAAGVTLALLATTPRKKEIAGS